MKNLPGCTGRMRDSQSVPTRLGAMSNEFLLPLHRFLDLLYSFLWFPHNDFALFGIGKHDLLNQR
jgi:hypothetical protein